MFGPANQGVGVSVGLSKDLGVRQRPLDISPYAGTRVSLTHSQYFQAMGSTDNYFADVASLEQYLEVPWWKGHVFYINLRGGYTEGTSLINSYFESGGDIIFYEYREYFLNRGLGYAEIPFSRRIINLNLEYRFPVARIERGIGLWPLFLKTISAALIADVTTRDLGHGTDYNNSSNGIFNVYFPSTGIELTTDWIFSYYMPGQIVLGAYHGFGPYGSDLNVSMGLNASF